MARKRGAPGSTGGPANDELSDVLAQPGADLPLPTDAVRTAEGAIEPSAEEKEYERLHQPPPVPTAPHLKEEGEAAARRAMGEPEPEHRPREQGREPPDWEI